MVVFNHMKYQAYKKQSGAVLVTALTILLIMTVLALSSLRGTVINSQQVRNIQTVEVINQIVEGEILAQAERFANRNAFTDGFLVNNGVPGNVPRITNVGVPALEPVVQIRDLTSPGNLDFRNRQMYSDSYICPNIDTAAQGCKKMLLTVQVNHPRFGPVTQHIGFGVLLSGSGGGGGGGGGGSSGFDL